MKITKALVTAYFKAFLPKSLLVGLALSLVTTLYLYALSHGWTLFDIAKALGVWFILWTFAALVILPKISKEKS